METCILHLRHHNTDHNIKYLNTDHGTNNSEFRCNLSVGKRNWQFEQNNLHAYDYSWNGTVASFNTTVDGGAIVTPTFTDGLLLVDLTNITSMMGGVAAINVTDGQTVWTANVPNMMMTQPLTYEGLVIIGLGNNVFQSYVNPQVRGTGRNYVAALNFSTGQTVWTFPTNGEDMPTPVIYNGLLSLLTETAKFMLSTRQLDWKFGILRSQ